MPNLGDVDWVLQPSEARRQYVEEGTLQDKSHLPQEAVRGDVGRALIKSQIQSPAQGGDAKNHRLGAASEETVLTNGLT